MKTIHLALAVLFMQLLGSNGVMIEPNILGLHSLRENYRPLYILLSLSVDLIYYGALVWIFIRLSKLASRLPTIVPGKNFLVIGLCLYLVFRIIWTFGGAGFDKPWSTILFYMRESSELFLLIGAVQLFLSASPSLSAEQSK